MAFKAQDELADTPEAADRCIRAWAPIVLALSSQGSERQIKYEKKVIREIAEKINGRFSQSLPDIFTTRFCYTDDGATRGDYCPSTVCNFHVGLGKHKSLDPEDYDRRGRFWQ